VKKQRVPRKVKELPCEIQDDSDDDYFSD
jgi:hypothetical protein